MHPDTDENHVTQAGDPLERAAKRLVFHLLWLVPLVLLPIAFYVRAFHDLFQSEAVSAAQTAREMVRGHGFATLWAHPIEVALRGGQFPRPEVSQGPLHPTVLALFFGAASESDKVVAAVSLVFLIATGLVLFVLVNRLFGRTAAALSVVFLVAGVHTLVLAISGRGATMAMFLVTLAALLLVGRNASPGRAAAAGAVLALGYLTDYSTLVLVLPFGLFAIYSAPEGRWRRAAAFGGAFVLVAAPWWVRNARVAGDPFFSTRRYWIQMFTGAHPGFALYRSTDASGVGVWSFLAGYPVQFARKVAVGLRSLHGAAPTSVGVYVVAFFIAGVLHSLHDERARLLRRCLYLALVLQAVLAAAQNGDVGFVIPLVPLVLAFAVAFFVRLLEGVESRAARGWAVAVFLGLAGYPTLVGLVAPGMMANPSRHNLAALRELPENTVVVSDVPWAVAWYADRPAVWLPLEAEDFEVVRRRADVGAVYLSHGLLTWPAQEKPGPWRLMGQTGLRGFVPAWAPQERGGEVLLVREDIAPERPGGHSLQPPTAAPLPGEPEPRGEW